MIPIQWRLNLAALLFFMLVQVVVPLIPRYALVIGGSPFMIGLAVSSISITAIFFRPSFGILSDRRSRSRLMLMGLVFGSVAYAILFLSRNITTIMVARLVEGCAVAAFVPPSMASAVDLAPEGKVGGALGWRAMMTGIGFTVGPSLGGFLSEIFGYVVTFGITSVLLLTVIPLVVFKEVKRHPPTASTSTKGLKERNFLLALFSMLIYAMAWMGLLTFLSAYLKLLGYGDLEIGLFVSIQALASLLLRVLAGRASDRYPETMTFVGLLIISLSFFAVYMIQIPPYLYLASVVFGVGVGLFLPGSQTLALGKSPASSRGFLAGIYLMGYDVGNLSGPIILGIVIQATGIYQNAFMIAPFLTLVAALVVFLIVKFSKGNKT
jgi:MFS family permease